MSVVHGSVAALVVLWLYAYDAYTFLGSLLSSLFLVSLKPIIIYILNPFTHKYPAHPVSVPITYSSSFILISAEITEI